MVVLGIFISQCYATGLMYCIWAYIKTHTKDIKESSFTIDNMPEDKIH